jgi:signal peptidase I
MIRPRSLASPSGASFPILLGVAVLVAVLVRTLVLQTFFIPSQSMEHTLNVWDHVLVNKLVYDFRGPHRGEIIVFRAPSQWQNGKEGEDFIKRIIGISGDQVQCCDPQGRLVINGKAIDEPFVYRNADGTQDPAADRPFSITVPPGRLWVWVTTAPPPATLSSTGRRPATSPSRRSPRARSSVAPLPSSGR